MAMTKDQILPPEADTISSLVNIAGILSLIIGIIIIIFGAVFLFVFIGIFLIAMGVLDIVIYTECNSIRKLIGERRYREAKSKTLTWAIVGFIFGWFVVGILLIIAYLKFDDLIRWAQREGVISY